MKSLKSLAAGTTLALGLLANPALAETNPCGNIELSAIGECHFEFEGGCKANCQPLNFVAACDGECNIAIDQQCTSSCDGTCQAECAGDAGQFDCEAACKTDCKAKAEAQCDSADNDCKSYAEANCNSECEASCTIDPPEATCEGECNACCGATCEVDANFDCSLDCSVDLKGGCDVQCEKPEGALFCDGQYLNVSDFPACLQYLAENFNVEVEFEAQASIDATGCSVEQSNDEQNFAALMMFGMIGVGLAAARRGRK